MTRPGFADQPELADVLALDDEIEALRAGALNATALPDPQDTAVLDVLARFRDDVDVRAATLIGERGLDLQGLNDSRPFGETADDAVAVRRMQSRRRRMRLAVLPVAGALVLGSTGVAAALSGSPDATLYPLHEFIFGPSKPKPVNLKPQRRTKGVKPAVVSPSPAAGEPSSPTGVRPPAAARNPGPAGTEGGSGGEDAGQGSTGTDSQRVPDSQSESPGPQPTAGGDPAESEGQAPLPSLQPAPSQQWEAPQGEETQHSSSTNSYPTRSPSAEPSDH